MSLTITFRHVVVDPNIRTQSGPLALIKMDKPTKCQTSNDSPIHHTLENASDFMERKLGIRPLPLIVPPLDNHISSVLATDNTTPLEKPLGTRGVHDDIQSPTLAPSITNEHLELAPNKLLAIKENKSSGLKPAGIFGLVLEFLAFCVGFILVLQWKRRRQSRPVHTIDIASATSIGDETQTTVTTSVRLGIGAMPMARMLDTPDVDFDSSSMDDGQDILLQQYDLEMQATAFSLSRIKSHNLVPDEKQDLSLSKDMMFLPPGHRSMSTISQDVDTIPIVEVTTINMSAYDYGPPIIHQSTRSVNSISDSSIFPSESEASNDHDDFLPPTILTISKRPKCSTTKAIVPRISVSPNIVDTPGFPLDDISASLTFASNISLDSCSDTGSIVMGVYGSLVKNPPSTSTYSISCFSRTTMLP